MSGEDDNLPEGFNRPQNSNLPRSDGLPEDGSEFVDNSDPQNPRNRPPPPAATETSAPITSADLNKALTEAIKTLNDGFAAQIGEIRSTQQMLQDRLLASTVRQQLFPTTPSGLTGAQGAASNYPATDGATTQPETVGDELLRLRQEMKQLASRVDQRDHPTPEIEKAIARTDSSPFTSRLNTVTLKEQTTTRLPYYSGTENPSNWLLSFKFAMKRQTYENELEREANYCHVFSEHLTKSALTWFTNLPSGSIDSFKDLTRKFLQHYSMLMTKSNLNLFTMEQGKDETLRKFMDRFRAALPDHSDVADDLKLKALVNGVWYRTKFSKNLLLDPPTTLQEALHRAQKYILLEENTSFNDQRYGPVKATTPKHEVKAEAKPRTGKPTSYVVQKSSAPASSSASKSPHQWNRGDPTLPPKKEIPYDEDHSLTCTFHNRTGHSTETCQHLLEKLVDMYNSGTIQVDHGPSEARQKSNSQRRHENRIAADKRKADAEKAALPPAEADPKRDREEPGDEGGDLPPAPRRRILMIMGGLPDCDDTVSAIRNYERKATSARRFQDPMAVGPTIHFGPRDATGLDTPHNDPLVVELNVQNCEVTKILVDTGSNVNLIFKETLEKMGINEDEIKPSAKPLTGFTGNHFFCIGTIYLTVCAGGITKTIKFVVMDKPAIYNAILGTPWIHEMKGVVSTYHQCMKFPIPTGIFTLRGSQQTSRSCYLSERRLRTASACTTRGEMDTRLFFPEQQGGKFSQRQPE